MPAQEGGISYVEKNLSGLRSARQPGRGILRLLRGADPPQQGRRTDGTGLGRRRAGRACRGGRAGKTPRADPALDYPGAKAYGIFKDKNGDFVVYKNKADGSRAVRYRGPDEAYAVNELFQKLKDEASGQRARVAAARTPGYPASSAHGNNPYNHPNEMRASRRPRKRKTNALLIGIIAAAAAITIGRTAAAIHNNTQQVPHFSQGYYQYNDNYYYNYNDDWYLYNNDIGTWYPIYTVDDELTDNYYDYYTSYSYDDDYGVQSFSDSSYYDDYSGSSSYSSDWDSGSDSDWDSGWDWDDDDDWDSSSDWDWDSDWDSDWGDWDSDW